MSNPTEKKFVAKQQGPVHFELSLFDGPVRVVAEQRDHAEIVVSTPDTVGPAAEAVRAAQVNDLGDALRLNIRISGGGASSVVQVGRAGRQINVFGPGGSSSFVVGNIVGGVVVGNNFGVIATGDAVVVSGGGGFVYVEARLPIGSTLDASTTSGDIETAGHLKAVTARSTSGDVSVAAATSVDLRTVSGDVHVDELHGSGQVNSVSGDLRVHAAQGPEGRSLRAKTVSGDITLTGVRLDLDAQTVSGRLRQR